MRERLASPGYLSPSKKTREKEREDKVTKREDETLRVNSTNDLKRLNELACLATSSGAQEI